LCNRNLPRPRSRQVFATLTVEENLRLGGYQQKSAAQLKSDIDRCYTLFPSSARGAPKSRHPLRGEQQMLAIAVPSWPARNFTLDEPSLGLAPLVVRKIFSIIREINSTGTTVFYVEQNAHMALTIANRG